MSALDDTTEDELQRFLSELPQNEAYVRVCRVDPITGKLRLCRGGRLDLANYSPDVVEAKWGGGEFKIEVYDGKGAGARRRIPVFIEGPPKEEGKDDRAGLELGPPGWAGRVPDPPQAPMPPEQLALAISQAIGQALAPVLGSLERTVQSLNTRPAPEASKQPSLVELTEALKNLQEISRPPASAAPVAAPTNVSQLKELLQLAKEISSPGSDDETGPLELLNKAIDKIAVPVVEMMRTNPGAGAPGSRPHPQAAPEAPPAMPRPHPLQTYVNMLYASFSSDEPPDNWVGLVVDRVPDDQLALLLPDPVPELAKIDPRCAAEPFASWLRDLGNQCAEALKPDDDTPPAAG